MIAVLIAALFALPMFTLRADAGRCDTGIDNGFGNIANLHALNSEEDDFAPVYNRFDGKIYFNSIRNKYSRFYFAEYSDSTFSPPKLLNSPLNEGRQNRSYISFHSEKTAFLSTFNHTATGSFLNISKSLFQRNFWSQAAIVDEIADASFNAHPTISPNGEMMVFASNRGKSSKDTDLWIAYMQADDSWGMMILMDELSSNGNEITPAFASDSLLLFASDGFYGPGGFDIYYSKLNNGIWSKPLPLNNINTEYSESDPALLPDGNLIFASDRPGGRGKLDMYIATPNAALDLKDEPNTLILSSTTTDIIIKKNSFYDNISISPYIFDTVNFSFNNVSPEKIDAVSPAIIASRILDLNADYSIAYNYEYRDKIIEFCIKSNLDTNKIVPAKIEWKKAIAIFYCEDSRIFEPVQRQELLCETIPHAMQLNVNWNENISDIVNLKASFPTENARMDTVNIDIYEKKLIFPLENICSYLSENDSLIIDIIATNGKNIELKKSMNFEIQQTEKKEIKKHLINNKLYFDFFSYYNSSDFDSYYKHNNTILNQVVSLLQYHKKMNIYTGDLDTKFMNKLKSLFGADKIIKFEKSAKNKNFIEFQIEVNN